MPIDRDSELYSYQKGTPGYFRVFSDKNVALVTVAVNPVDIQRYKWGWVSNTPISGFIKRTGTAAYYVWFDTEDRFMYGGRIGLEGSDCPLQLQTLEFEEDTQFTLNSFRCEWAKGSKTESEKMEFNQELVDEINNFLN